MAGIDSRARDYAVAGGEPGRGEHHDRRSIAEVAKLVTAPDASTSRRDWADFVPHDEDVFIDGYELFDGFTAIAERSGGLERIRLLKAGGGSEYVQAQETAYSMGLDANSEHDTPWLRCLV